MKKIMLCVFILTASLVKAQSIVDSISDPSFILRDTVSEKLAEFAVNNYQIMMQKSRVNEMQYEVKKSKAAWLNNIAVTGNLNEANLKSSNTGGQNVFFPRYNFGLTLPLGTFFTKSNDTKIAKEKYNQEVYNLKGQLELLKKAIKVEYQNYLSNKYFIALHESVIQDEKVLLSVVEAKFSKNEVSLDAYTQSSKRYNDALIKKVELLKNLNTSKLELEGLLGMKLEEALVRMVSNN